MRFPLEALPELRLAVEEYADHAATALSGITPSNTPAQLASHSFSFNYLSRGDSPSGLRWRLNDVELDIPIELVPSFLDAINTPLPGKTEPVAGTPTNTAPPQTVSADGASTSGGAGNVPDAGVAQREFLQGATRAQEAMRPELGSVSPKVPVEATQDGTPDVTVGQITAGQRKPGVFHVKTFVWTWAITSVLTVLAVSTRRGGYVHALDVAASVLINGPFWGAVLALIVGVIRKSNYGAGGR